MSRTTSRDTEAVTPGLQPLQLQVPDLVQNPVQSGGKETERPDEASGEAADQGEPKRTVPDSGLSSEELCEMLAEIQVRTLNSRPGNLNDGYDCPDCLNRGFFFRAQQGGRICIPCPCMKIRENLRLIRKSGLESLLERYSFENWRTEESWQGRALELARQFAANPDGHWFVITGSVGTGKTHLCTAICSELIHRGIPTRYLLWRDFSAQAKGLLNSPEYQQLLDPVKRVDVLYIDDLFKNGATPTAGDLNLVFELLNFRYNDIHAVTLISSELSTSGLLSLDEAVGSRIVERSYGYRLEVGTRRNVRMEPYQ